MRGEHVEARFLEHLQKGSSPHARGTQERNPHGQLRRGIIPACAGNTRRTWGLERPGRIIPACAGNTSPSQAKAWTPRDHPRMRGEHTPNPQSTPNSAGSSPHARGTRLRKKSPKRSGGIIPACAGNTCDFCLMLASRGDHPRMRGEHPPPVSSTTANSGSSPHARGTPSAGQLHDGELGIIPACAGNTSLPLLARLRLGDHPRMRGEHTRQVNLWQRNMGSSPHARGTRVVCLRPHDVPGIIPACAGNTGGRFRLARLVRDHPRMRGEHVSALPPATALRGSSPHARGTHVGRGAGSDQDGIIPACAGNT